MADLVGCSGGKDSTAMSLRLKELYPEREFIFFCTPTGDELPELLDHWKRLEDLLGQELVRVQHPFTLNELIEEFGALPNWRQRWCTRMLKIETALAYYQQFDSVTAYIGLRADEEARKGGIYDGLIDQVYPLREWGWGLGEVMGYLENRGVEIPRRTDCARCYGQRIIDWFHLWRDYPELYEEAEAQEHKTGFTFRSPGRDTWPAPLSELKKEFERGRKIRGFSNPDACRVCSL